MADDILKDLLDDDQDSQATETTGQPEEKERTGQRIQSLVSKLKEKDSIIAAKEKELAEVTKQLDAGASPKDLDNRVDKLEFQLTLTKKYPKLEEKAEELYALRKNNPGEPFEDTVAKYVGKALLDSANPYQGASQGGNTMPYPTAANDKPLEKLSDDEIEAQAKEELRQKGYM